MQVFLNSSKRTPCNFIHERFSKLKNTHYLKEDLIFQTEQETGQGIQDFHVICQYDNTRATHSTATSFLVFSNYFS